MICNISRDFINVEDVTEMNVRALSIDNQIINVGCGLPIKIIDVAQEIKRQLNSKSKISISSKYRVGDIKSNYADTTLMNSFFKASINIDEAYDMAEVKEPK